MYKVIFPLIFLYTPITIFAETHHVLFEKYYEAYREILSSEKSNEGNHCVNLYESVESPFKGRFVFDEFQVEKIRYLQLATSEKDKTKIEKDFNGLEIRDFFNSDFTGEKEYKKLVCELAEVQKKIKKNKSQNRQTINGEIKKIESSMILLSKKRNPYAQQYIANYLFMHCLLVDGANESYVSGIDYCGRAKELYKEASKVGLVSSSLRLIWFFQNERIPKRIECLAALYKISKLKLDHYDLIKTRELVSKMEKEVSKDTILNAKEMASGNADYRGIVSPLCVY